LRKIDICCCFKEDSPGGEEDRRNRSCEIGLWVRRWIADDGCCMKEGWKDAK